MNPTSRLHPHRRPARTILTRAMLATRAQAGRRAGGLDPDSGQVALFMALFTVALIALAGLVIDGGASLAARGRAHDVAAQAARAGADSLSPASLRGATPQDLAVDPAAARAAAQKYLTAGDATGTITIRGQDVTVTAHVTRRATILSAFGISDMSGTASATATIVHGTTGGQ